MLFQFKLRHFQPGKGQQTGSPKPHYSRIWVVSTGARRHDRHAAHASVGTTATAGATVTLSETRVGVTSGATERRPSAHGGRGTVGALWSLDGPLVNGRGDALLSAQTASGCTTMESRQPDMLYYRDGWHTTVIKRQAPGETEISSS